MKTLTGKTNPIGILFGVLALIAFVTIAPHAFAQTFTTADNPHGPMEMFGWAGGMAVVGVMVGVGVWTAIRKK